MKKYKSLKWLVLFVAVGSVICFFTPFTNYLGYESGYSEDYHYFENSFGAPLGIEFVFGKASFSNPVFTAAIWLSRVSFVVAIAAIVLAVLPLVIEHANGLNKQGKFHKELIISSGLAFLSALINFITIQAGCAKECEVVGYYNRVYTIHVFYGNYTYIGLIIISVFLIPVIMLAVKSQKEIANTEDAPQDEKSKRVKSKGGKSQVSTCADDSPEGKPLEWFASEAGLEVYKAYITPQNYILEEAYKKDLKENHNSENFDVIERVHFETKLPHTFFKALIENIDADALEYSGLRETLIVALEEEAKPYIINEDGEPELRKMALTPEQIVSVEINPILYFVKNFDAFKIESDTQGIIDDKRDTYKAALMFVSGVADEIVMEENKWLLDKNTYLNEFGMVRKVKGFAKKCIELTDNIAFKALLSTLAGLTEFGKQAAAAYRQDEERRQQEYAQQQQAEELRQFNEQQINEQRKQTEEQKKLMQKQMEEQKRLAQMQACATTTCPNCRRQCGMASYNPSGNAGCACFIKK